MLLEVNLAIFTVSLTFFSYSIIRFSIKRISKRMQSKTNHCKNYGVKFSSSQFCPYYPSGNHAYAETPSKLLLNNSISSKKLFYTANFVLIVDYLCLIASVLLWLGYFEQLQIYGGIHMSHGQLFEVLVLHNFLFFLIDHFVYVSSIALVLELIRWIVLKSSNHWIISISATSLSLLAPALNQNANNITLLTGLVLTSILVYVNSTFSDSKSQPSSTETLHQYIANGGVQGLQLHPSNHSTILHPSPQRYQPLPQLEELKCFANKMCWREPRKKSAREETPAKKIRQLIEDFIDNKEADESKSLKEHINIFNAQSLTREEMFPRKCKQNTSNLFKNTKEQTPTREICRILKKIDLQFEDFSMQ